jgi:predicted nucleic acid-binding protein
MAFPAFLDTCAIYGSYVADTLLRIAEAGAFRPLWSAEVLSELERALMKNAGLTEQRARHRTTTMRKAFPEAEIFGSDSLVDAMTCDTKDRHVLAAAVIANAEVLVTFNLKDFPPESTDPYDIQVIHPDEFLLDQLDLYPGLVVRSLHEQVDAYRNPAMTVEDLLAHLTAAGLAGFALEVRRHL